MPNKYSSICRTLKCLSATGINCFFVFCFCLIKQHNSAGAAWNSGQSSGSPRNRKRKSGSGAAAAAGVKASSGNSSASPRKSSKNSSAVNLGNALLGLPTTPVASDQPSGKKSVGQVGPLYASSVGTGGRAGSSSKSASSMKQSDRGAAPSSSSGSAVGMYEESSELDVTQFTPGVVTTPSDGGKLLSYQESTFTQANTYALVY